MLPKTLPTLLYLVASVTALPQGGVTSSLSSSHTTYASTTSSGEHAINTGCPNINARDVIPGSDLDKRGCGTTRRDSTGEPLLNKRIVEREPEPVSPPQPRGCSTTKRGGPGETEPCPFKRIVEREPEPVPPPQPRGCGPFRKRLPWWLYNPCPNTGNEKRDPEPAPITGCGTTILKRLIWWRSCPNQGNEKRDPELVSPPKPRGCGPIGKRDGIGNFGCPNEPSGERPPPVGTATPSSSSVSTPTPAPATTPFPNGGRPIFERDPQRCGGSGGLSCDPAVQKRTPLPEPTQDEKREPKPQACGGQGKVSIECDIAVREPIPIPSPEVKIVKRCGSQGTISYDPAVDGPINARSPSPAPKPKPKPRPVLRRGCGGQGKISWTRRGRNGDLVRVRCDRGLIVEEREPQPQPKVEVEKRGSFGCGGPGGLSCDKVVEPTSPPAVEKKKRVQCGSQGGLSCDVNEEPPSVPVEVKRGSANGCGGIGGLSCDKIIDPTSSVSKRGNGGGCGGQGGLSCNSP